MAKKSKVYISVGSNTPDKKEKVEKALNELSLTFSGFRQSDTYCTRCWHGGTADYCNAVAFFETSDTVSDLEALFKTMEKSSGREAGNRVSVPLDIDVVVYDNRIVRPRDYDRDYFIKGYTQLCDPRNIEIEDYVYNLPEERIALYPLSRRDACKLLVCERNGVIESTNFYKIGEFLPKDSYLIYNDTKVINARLRFEKESGASIEVFCLEPLLPSDYQLNFASVKPVRWKCLVGNSKRWKSGELKRTLNINGKEVEFRARRIEKVDNYSVIEFSWNDEKVSFSEVISAAGSIPIPPYLNRDTEATDSEDYQTVYSHSEGSVAAPTAGLHFTDELLDSLRKSGIQTESVTLHVGAGTFTPVKTKSIGEHHMHFELIDVHRSLIEKLADTSRPVTAVGTTTVRTLESLYHIGCRMATGTWDDSLDQWYPYSATHPRLSVKDAMTAILKYLEEEKTDRLVTSTGIIIAPGYRYRVVDNLITNFHQPGSTLLLLVSAITGDNWKEIYSFALDHDYRFLSYGDACLFLDIMD